MSYFKQKVSEEVFKEKYCLNGETGIEDVFRGVAEEIAEAETSPELKKEWRDKFYSEMINQRFFPGGRIMANARINTKMRYYNNCYTIDVKDSIPDIYTSLKEDAEISSTGGGVGTNISYLRPKGSSVSKGGESSGVISFLKIFNESAKVILTGGSRRAAHIAILNIDHPEIEDFITCKQGDKDKVLNQFNISVGIPNRFYEAVEKDLDWDLVFDGKVYKTVKAQYLYNLIMENSYKHNEPGIFNTDIVEENNNGWWAFLMDRCNPCGEIVMPPYSVCDLGSVFLPAFVRNAFTANAWFDSDAFIHTIRVAVRFLDNVLDRTKYPLDKIEKMSTDWRRIGLGFTGLGDFFAMMGCRYGSPDSQMLSANIGKVLRDTSYRTSLDLAKEKGKFPACDNDKLIQSKFIQKSFSAEMIEEIGVHGLRNIGLNTVAPTGTQSLTVGNNCSSGIEPIFALQYDRNIRTGRGDETRKETVYDKAWLEYIEEFGEPKEVPHFFATTMDISAEDGIEIQSIFQKYVDHSISKTINIPPKTTFEEYKGIYRLAYEKGLKGVTSFNPEGSMKGVLEYSGSNRNEDRITIERPDSLPCVIRTTKVKGETFTVLIGLLDGKPYELFVTAYDERLDGKKEGWIKKRKKNCYDLYSPEDTVVIKDLSNQFNPQYGVLSRLISMSLRHEVPLQFIVGQLLKGNDFISFEKAVARELKKFIGDNEKSLTSDKCPDCGEPLVYVEGCKKCLSCNWGKCD